MIARVHHRFILLLAVLLAAFWPTVAGAHFTTTSTDSTALRLKEEGFTRKTVSWPDTHTTLANRAFGAEPAIVFFDGAGNVTAMMDGNQNSVGRYLYDPFGRLDGQSGVMALVNAMGYSSMPTHRPSGLVLFPDRPYNPILDRWNSQDPIGEMGGINLYGFVGNSPLSHIDPFGLYPKGYDPDDDELDARLDIAANNSALFADLAYDKDAREQHAKIICEAKQDIKNFLTSAAKEGAKQAAIFAVTEGVGTAVQAVGLALDEAAEALDATETTFAPGEIMPNGQIAGDGPGGALGNGPDFAANVPRPFSDLVKDVSMNPSKWDVVKTETVPSTNIRNAGGSSVQELLRNKETGEEIVQHTLLKSDGNVFAPSHFRPYWK